MMLICLMVEICHRGKMPNILCLQIPCFSFVLYHCTFNIHVFKTRLAMGRHYLETFYGLNQNKSAHLLIKIFWKSQNGQVWHSHRRSYFFFNKDKSHFNKTLYCCRHVLAYMFGAEQSLWSFTVLKAALCLFMFLKRFILTWPVW